MRTVVASVGTLVLLVGLGGCVTRVVERRAEPASVPAATVITTPGTTVVVTAPAETVPYCGGVYAPAAGTNFASCTTK